MGFSIGKWLGDAVKTVENTVDKGVHAVEDVAKNVAGKVEHAADVFEHGFIDPMKNFGSRGDVNQEPELMPVNGQMPTYGTVNGQLFANGISPEDIDQGANGDCYFLASLAAVAQTHPELIQKAIRQNADGTYSVDFHEPPGMDWMRATGIAGVNSEGYLSRWLGIAPSSTSTVTMDGQLPLIGGEDPYNKTHGNELWASLMEKAYAKWWGGYAAIGNGGDGAEGLMAITGAKVDRIGMGGGEDQVWQQLTQAAAAKQPMVTSRFWKPETPGLVNSHVYTVMGTETVNGERYVDLRNPWGSTEPGDDGANDGEFKMKLSDFVKQYNYVDVARTP
jgi:hypothetical protein